MEEVYHFLPQRHLESEVSRGDISRERKPSAHATKLVSCSCCGVCCLEIPVLQRHCHFCVRNYSLFVVAHSACYDIPSYGVAWAVGVSVRMYGAACLAVIGVTFMRIGIPCPVGRGCPIGHSHHKIAGVAVHRNHKTALFIGIKVLDERVRILHFFHERYLAVVHCGSTLGIHYHTTDLSARNVTRHV